MITLIGGPLHGERCGEGLTASPLYFRLGPRKRIGAVDRKHGECLSGRKRKITNSDESDVTAPNAGESGVASSFQREQFFI